MVQKETVQPKFSNNGMEFPKETEYHKVGKLPVKVCVHFPGSAGFCFVGCCLEEGG